MKLSTDALLIGIAVLLAGNVQAASPYAGKTKAAAVCAQCHGMRMPAAEALFPFLGGRDVQYLRLALRQYRDKTRLSPIMNNIAGSLSDRDIDDITAYYSGLKP